MKKPEYPVLCTVMNDRYKMDVDVQFLCSMIANALVL